MISKNKIINLWKKIKKPKTIWLIFISFITSFLGLILSQINHAQAKDGGGLFGFLTDIGSKVITFPIVIIGEIVSFIAGNIVILEGKILDTIVSDSLFTKLIFVQKGWAAARDIANLFFIAILIYIAFAIILRLQKIDAKKMLFKVITMAIIINFSLMIGGIIIDFSQVLFRFFIFGGLKEGVSFSTGLANSVRLQDYWSAAGSNLNESSSLDENSLTFGSKILVRITQALTKATLMSIAALAFGALAITLVVRNIWLWVLLILAPIAWFVGIIPLGELSSLNKKWWNNFIKWVLIAPVMGFFIYLVLMMGSVGGYLINTTVESGSDVFSKQFNLTSILQFIVVIGLMVGSLMAGQSLGSSAAGGALGMVNKAKKGTQKWMGRKVANNPLTRGVTSLGARGLNQLSTVPIIGRAFKGLTADASKKRDDLRKEKGKLSKDLTSDQLKGMWKNLNDQEKAEGAKKIGFDKLSEQQFEAMQKIYSKQGYEKELKDLQKAQPHLTDKFKENAEKMIEKKQEFSKSDEPYKVAEKEETKAKEKIDSDKIAYQKANENIEGLKKAGAETTEAEAIREMARLNLAASTADFKKVKDRKDALRVKRDVAKKEYEQSRVPLMESLEGVDLSKSSTISNILADKNSTKAQALYDIIKEQSSDKIMKLISNLESKDASGKRNFDQTIKLKKDVGINLTERLFLDAGGGNEGVEAVLKMRAMDSSPAARAGGYNFNSLIDGADKKVIDGSTGRLIKEMAKKQLKGDKLMKEIAESMRREGDQDSSRKKTGGESSESEEEKKV